MRHHDKVKKFGRVRKQRKALVGGLARSLILKGKIKTTQAKAKALRSFVEKLITRAKVDNVATRRIVMTRLFNDRETTKALFETVAKKYSDKNGGYTRVVKMSPRKSDGAPQAVIEFV